MFQCAVVTWKGYAYDSVVRGRSGAQVRLEQEVGPTPPRVLDNSSPCRCRWAERRKLLPFKDRETLFPKEESQSRCIDGDTGLQRGWWLRLIEENFLYIGEVNIWCI